MREVYQISQQTSYPLFDCDTSVNEVRFWESVSRATSKSSLFLKDYVVSTHVYYLAGNSSSKQQKVIGIVSTQERILDQLAEKEAPIFKGHGGLALTCHEGVGAVIDSLFKLGFADMQSQPQEEQMRVGDGTSYIIEVRHGSYYKYVYYHGPEYFDNEPARKFIRICRFLTQARWHIPAPKG